MSYEHEAVTLTLVPPLRCEHSTTAIEKWLLALWQIAGKSTWRLWRDRASIALEYVANDSGVTLQARFGRRDLATLTMSLLPNLVPDMDVEEVEAPVHNPSQGSAAGAILSFQLRSPGWIDLAKDASPAAVDGIVGALSSLPLKTSAIIQILLEPTWMRTEDGNQPAFWLAGRIHARAPSARSSSDTVRILSGTLGQLAGFNGLRFGGARPAGKRDLESLSECRWLRALLPPGQPTTPAQVASFFHPPETSNADGLRRVRAVRLPAQEETDPLELGTGRDSRRRTIQVGLSPQDLLRHGLVVGPSGTGKSTLLTNLALALATADAGMTVIDPHGTLVRDIAKSLPVKRADDAALVSFADREYPVSLNPLRVRPGQEFLAADELVEVVQRVYGGEYWGPLIDLMLRHAAMAAAEIGGSIVESARLLDDPWFREQALSRISNPETVRILGQLGTSGYERRLLPAINRLQRLLATPLIRHIVGQQTPGIDFNAVFDERRILLFDLSGLGATNARLLGSLILLLLRQATFSRRAGNSSVHVVLVDEASWFVSRTVSELYDQARKFGVGIVLAVQRLAQLIPADVRDAVLANAGTLATFRISDPDEASAMARRLASDRIAGDDLRHLGAYEAYLQITRNGQRLDPAWMRASDMPVASQLGGQMLAQLKQNARQRYARPRLVVEAELRERDRSTLADDEPEIRAIAPTFSLSTNAA